jgi:hypothetical protein
MKNYPIAKPAIANVTHFRVGAVLPTETGVKVEAKFGRETESGSFNRRSQQWVELTEAEYKRVKNNEASLAKLVASKLELDLTDFEASLPDEDVKTSSDDSLTKETSDDIPPVTGEVTKDNTTGADDTATSAPKSSKPKGDTKPKSDKKAKADVKPKSKAKG